MSIEVHVRLRPGVAQSVWSSAETVLYSTQNPDARFVYSKVHPPTSGNQVIFQNLEAVIHAAFDGKNVTVMAYGQTGSGKTHSMIGTAEDSGVVPRAARLLLDLVRSHPGTTLRAYYTEIYNESVKDLLEPQRGELQLHDAPDGGVRYEKKMVTVESYDDFLVLQAAAERNRKYGVTNLNDHSSRSHTILTFEIHRGAAGGGGATVVKSVINMVDLAGSESAARANTEGTALREGGFINRSLLSLGNVVDAIVERRSYVPYRDAKLTRMLRPCLGGSGITFILCCVNPSRENFEQTIATLRFTQRAMRIKNDPVVVLSLPPLFAHQYQAATAAFFASERDEAETAYRCGLRDAFLYSTNTAGSVVGQFQAQVEGGLHALADLQRQLVAHDHAMALSQLGEQQHRLGDWRAARQRAQAQGAAAVKRAREDEDVCESRRRRCASLEAHVRTAAGQADMDLAGWEYRLQTARRRQVPPLEVVVAAEACRRQRLVYEHQCGLERLAARCVPALQQRLQQAPPAAGVNRAQEIQRLRDGLAQARNAVEDLESACEMVQDDIRAAKQQLLQQAEEDGGERRESPRATTGPGEDAGGGGGDCHVRYRAIPDQEIERSIARLEREERQLLQRARREVRQQSLRQVRESLSRTPPPPPAEGGGGQGSTSPSPAPPRGRAGASPPAPYAYPVR
ncbi:kinesin [Strigomonas culicis]|uniref:Kinesin-like protein n=1 Tax=Strigomonas culicis TaxID=28005 RepID=S9V9W9_9TRYP|nr:kinesin [Strigomonas culicis]|eukprot:EPY19785.1 kinesin [Strigomonas culicis]